MTDHIKGGRPDADYYDWFGYRQDRVSGSRRRWRRQYFGARNADELEKALRSSIEVTYLVRDASGTSLAQGTVGADPIVLPPGRYAVVLRGLQEIVIRDIEVRGQMETRLTMIEGGSGPKIEQLKLSP